MAFPILPHGCEIWTWTKETEDFRFSTMVLVKSPVYWNMTPCFREASCLPLHGSPGTVSREQTVLFLD